MKKFLRKNLILFAILTAALFLFSCGDKPNVEEPAASQEENKEEAPKDSTEEDPKPAYTITAQEGYENTITVDEAAGTITLAPAVEGIEYTITGEFEGQIINKTKGTVITLNNANLKNTEGKAAIYGEAKIELKFKKDSTNTITVTGTDNTVYEEGKPDFSKAAVLCEKAIEIGGSGSCTISCENGHGVKGSKVELKGSGSYVFGPAKDSAINCNDFEVKADRTFTATLKNAKNGIKADNTISIASGTFKFDTIKKTALKTDTSADDSEGETKEHKITLEGGTFTFTNCGSKYSTEEGAFTKSETVIGDFN